MRNKHWEFIYTDRIFASTKEEAREKLLELYAAEGFLGLLETLFDEPEKEGTLNTGGKFKRIRRDA